MPTMHLDRTNLRLLELLQKNARMSVSELAREVNRGESTVRERIASLERQGVLRGYEARIDAGQLGYKVRALVRAGCDPRAIAALPVKLAAIPNVVSAHVTTGNKPLRIEVVAEDLQSLERIIAQRIAPLELDGIEVGVVLDTLVMRRAPPVTSPTPLMGNGLGRDGVMETPNRSLANP